MTENIAGVEWFVDFYIFYNNSLWIVYRIYVDSRHIVLVSYIEQIKPHLPIVQLGNN